MEEYYRTVYDAAGNGYYSPHPAVFVLFAAAGLMLVLFIVLTARRIGPGKTLVLPVTALIIVGCVAWHNTGLTRLREGIYDKYMNGEYETVEGTIGKFTADDGHVGGEHADVFIVKSIEFRTPGGVSPWGYSEMQKNGNLLEKGQKVRILYVTYENENVIMRLDILFE